MRVKHRGQYRFESLPPSFSVLDDRLKLVEQGFSSWGPAMGNFKAKEAKTLYNEIVSDLKEKGITPTSTGKLLGFLTLNGNVHNGNEDKGIRPHITIDEQTFRLMYPSEMQAAQALYETHRERAMLPIGNFSSGIKSISFS